LIYGDHEQEHEAEFEGIISPVISEQLHSFSTKNIPATINAETSSITSKMSKMAHITNQSMISPTITSLSDNCPYEYNTEELKGFDEIIDFIIKKISRIDSEMNVFISNSKSYKEKQVSLYWLI